MKVIRIEWDSGSANIVLEKFFPTSAEQIRKLMKLIRLGREHCMVDYDQMKHDIAEWMKDDIRLHEEIAKQKARSYINISDEISSFESRISSKKSAAGVPLTKDQLKQMKAELKTKKESAAKEKKEWSASERRVKRLNKNLEYLQNYRK